MKQKIGFFYALALALYFLISGFSALLNVPEKLKRIDLMALNSDGEIAFILIYTGLMVGIGIASLTLQFISKSWTYPLILTTTIIASFVISRIVGSLIIGNLSTSQINFLAFELVEVTIGIILLKNSEHKLLT